MTTNDHGKNDCALDQRSIQLREKLIRIVEVSGRGHIASALSLIEIIRVLYDKVLNYDPKNPKWQHRDRFVLSKGHGCLALYLMLAEKGFFSEEELWKFCRLDGLLGGHPEITIPGVEASTGSLGHGLSIGLGFALNAKIDNLDYRTFVVIGDGESNEGSIWEGAMFAAKHRLSNLTIIVDYNKQQSYGTTSEVLELEPFADKWKSFGLAVTETDGHDISALETVFHQLPLDDKKPSVVICHTIKGKGFSCTEGNLEWHHKSKITKQDIDELTDTMEVAR